MTLANPPTRFTPEDLLHLEKDGVFELVDGRLLEKPMSFLANKTAGIIIRRLADFAEKTHAGDVVPEQGFQCFPHDPELVRRPDVAFVTAPRAAQIPDEGHVRIPPDIAIEVISPGNTINEFEEKRLDYRKAGIPLVWEVNPRFRFIQVYRLDHRPERLEETDTITGEPVLPGFSILVQELLPPADKRAAK
ncbi:MAG TPA: Uma2 family endonuclease [Tepidisphaeraceae bacterium]|jgi:Uma2 family endonuclease|nr:Uma2 family endonuclease [Tepidisphaeraceae bacterium]